MNSVPMHLILGPTRWARLLAAVLLLMFTAGASTGAFAQTLRTLGVVRLNVPGSAPQNLYDQSHALIIGASNYRNGWPRLPGVLEDMKAVTAVMVKQGFSVSQLTDPTRDQLDAALRNFVAQYGQVPGNRLLVYFAGHGHTLTTAAGGRLGYIVPVDAPRPDTEPGGFKRAAYSMDIIEGHAKQIDSRHALFLFDSCFSGTIFRTRAGVPDSISDKTSKPVRQFITAGDENQTVPDKSIFRRQLEAALGDGEADLNHDGYITGSELGMFLEDNVTNYSRGTQTPRWGKIRDQDLDRGDFVFASPVQFASLKPEPVTPIAQPGQGGGLSLEDLEKEENTRKQWAQWQARMKADFDKTVAFKGSADLQVKAWERFLGNYGQDNPLSLEDEALRSQASSQREQAQRAVQLALVQVVPERREPTPQAAQNAKACTECPEMVVIPAGSFQMGSNDGETSEKPIHRVNIKSFELGKYEVTQGQWKAVMGSNPSIFRECGDTCPVEEVSWDAIQEYIKKLNASSGQQYRLPSEAEWEYACRAGTSHKYCGGDDVNAVGWYGAYADPVGNSAKTSNRVGTKQPNAWGLYDMSGNVWEWVQDCWNDSYRGAPGDGSAWTAGNCGQRVLRGGSWNNKPQNTRAANRVRIVATLRNYNNGFRLARIAP